MEKGLIKIRRCTIVLDVKDYYRKGGDFLFKEAEIKEILKDMILKSRSYEEIAEKVGCSAKATKNMAIRLFETSNQDKIRGKLKNEK